MTVKKSAATTRTAAKSAAPQVSEAAVEVSTPDASEAGAAEMATTEANFVEAAPKTVADVQQNVAAFVNNLTQSSTEVSKTMDKIVKSTEDFVAFGQGNVEALLKSGQVLATGLQDLGKLFAANAQASYDEAVANAKALSGVKSVKEAFDLQTSFAKASVEKALAETSKLTDASVKLAEQVTAPLAARVTLAVEKLGKAA